MKEYTAQEKCRAVLTVWLERKTAATLCREQGVASSLFSQWQDRALSGMLQALEPQRMRETSEGPALPETLRRLLDRKVRVRELNLAGRRPLTRPACVKRKAPEPAAPAAPG